MGLTMFDYEDVIRIKNVEEVNKEDWMRTTYLRVELVVRNRVCGSIETIKKVYSKDHWAKKKSEIESSPFFN